MAGKLTPGQVARELNDIVFTFSGKYISGWVQEAWERSQKTTIGQAAAGVERAARAIDPYAVLGLPSSASLEQVESQESGNHRIVGINQFTSPIPLEAV